MKFIIYKLEFQKGLRIGNGRIDLAEIEIPADIIFSSIINEAGNQDINLCEDLIDEILLSDAFPYVKDEFFLPKPLINIANNSGDSSEKKEFKKLKYIPLSRWDIFIKGDSDPRELNEIFQNHGEKIVDTRINYNESGKHDIYNIGYYRFYKDSGLYFILGYKSDELQEMIDELLYSLSFTGIGGKKSTSLGKFKMIEEDMPDILEKRINKEKSNMILTTSMAKEEELKSLFKGKSNYSLKRRGGFIYTEDDNALKSISKRKRTMHFFKSGSIFSERYYGDLFRVDSGFDHPVYRYSKPIWMEVDLNG
ncbi:MAG: type III-A CRISPR-associated RAMP protein Csm4 [Tissierellia bacterium]|nr:type III-A CRISPR-associated RAMP protein Csm4 [Tissierellia bacterium]